MIAKCAGTRADKERQWESEEVFEYLICVICPVDKEYEPRENRCVVLYPSLQEQTAVWII